MEIDTLSFPRKDRMLGFLKGARCSISSHPRSACLEYLPDHADRGFQAFHEGIFCLGEIDRTVITLVHDTATMTLCSIGRMRLQDSRVARWALDLSQFHGIDLIAGWMGSMIL